VANRFRGKTCVLCPHPSVGVGEHVIPKWFQDDFLSDAPFKSENAGRPYENRDGGVATWPRLPGAHVPMCKDCNDRMNTNIEQAAKPVIRGLVPRSASHAWPTISADEAAAAGRWLLKIALLWFHPEAEHDQPQVQKDQGLHRFGGMEPEWLAWMRQGTDPPDDVTMFIRRRSLYAEVSAAPNPTRRIELPGHVRVGNRELRFMSREFGIPGLDATMVWNPGWPIAHPLVYEGRVAVLWPKPTAIDFAALGEVHPDECRFDIFADSQETTEDDYRRWTAEHPLAEGISPKIR
jgi:hypothetical protein